MNQVDHGHNLLRGRARCRAFYFTLVAVVLLQPSRATAAAPELILDLRSPRTKIRKVLLEKTPPQTDAKEVAKFIAQHLPRSANAAVEMTDGPAPAIGDATPRGSKFIRVYLGQYYDHPEVVFFSAPMMAQREVTAYWIFDDKGKLIDVVVDKHTGIY